MLNNSEQSQLKVELYISMMIALLISVRFIADILASINIIKNGTIPIILTYIFMSLLLIILFNKNKTFNLNVINLVIVFIIYILLFITISLKGIDSFSYKYLIEFSSFGLLAYLLMVFPFNPKKVIYYNMLIGNMILLAPNALLSYAVDGYYYDRLEMGTTYAILPSIIATIIFIFFLRHNSNDNLLIRIISYFSNAYLFYIVLTKGNRGALLTIFILLLIVVYIKFSKLIKGKIKLLVPIMFSFISIIIVTISLNSVKLLYMIDNYLSKNGIEVAAIIKTINMFERNGLLGILNARDIIYEVAIEMFSNSPIVGNGIGSFGDDAYLKFDYPHNIILQIMVEGGLVALIPFTIIMMYVVYLIFKPWDASDELFYWRCLILFLFILCFPKLLISSYFWREQEFWLLIFSVMILFNKSNTQKIES